MEVQTKDIHNSYESSSGQKTELARTTSQIPPDGFKPTPQEAMKCLWEDYKMRQTHYWASFNRFALAIITVLVLPYIKPENVKPLGQSILFLPVLGLMLSLASTWLLGAEYQRLRSAKEKYEELLTKAYQPEYPSKSIWHCLFGFRIGNATTFMFGLGFSALSILDFILLYKIGN